MNLRQLVLAGILLLALGCDDTATETPTPEPPAVVPTVVPTATPLATPAAGAMAAPTVVPAATPLVISPARPMAAPATIPATLPATLPATIASTIAPAATSEPSPVVVPLARPAAVPALQPTPVPSPVPTATPDARDPYAGTFWGRASVGELREALAQASIRDTVPFENPVPFAMEESSILHLVVGRNPDPGATQLMLDLGATPDEVDDYGSTLLHIAAAGNNAQVVELLLDRGADVEAVNQNQESPLHVAASSNRDPGVVSLLLDRGANIDAVDHLDDTPVRGAAEYNRSADVMRVLLNRGADTSPDDAGFTLLHSASRNGATEIMRLLIDRGFAINSRTEDGATPLLHAIIGGEPAAVELLLDLGADPLDRDGYYGWTMLQYAASFYNLGRYHGTASEIAEVLLDRGADINVNVGFEQLTPLHLAVMSKRNEPDDLEIELYDYWGGDPNQLDLIEFLLEQGADMEARNERGETSLRIAAGGDNEELVHLLLDRGADASEPTGACSTAQFTRLLEEATIRRLCE